MKFIDFTKPDGSQISIKADHVTAISEQNKSPYTKIFFNDSYFKVHESFDEVVRRISEETGQHNSLYRRH